MRTAFKYLSQYSTNPVGVDRIIVSAFLEIHKLKPKKNKLLKTYLIKSESKQEYSSLVEFISCHTHRYKSIWI
jgi:adenine-specific DNA-methyltransferase